MEVTRASRHTLVESARLIPARTSLSSKPGDRRLGNDVERHFMVVA